MAENNQEIEAKFYLSRPQDYLQRLQSLRAELLIPRQHELNLRFDTPDSALTHERRVLRLRKDQGAHLTYKSPAQPGQSVSVREEIEVEVSNFDNTRLLLEALGYHVSIFYEKWRTTYRMGQVLVTLDEMPYGVFSELEGPNPVAIQECAAKLELDWEARCAESYLALFNQLCQARGLHLQNLSFAELAGIQVSPDDLGVRPADRD
jgi:adenylate cyclase class 2